MRSLKEEYPEVDSIISKYYFYDSETDLLTYSTDEKELNLNYISHFNITCICYECVNGGYDLNSIVSIGIRDKLSEISGSLRCVGWQDRQRINKHRCNTKLEYVFTITYRQ